MLPDQSPCYRYPGTKPFEAAEHELFKGRDDDINYLSELISLQNLVVLFGRSGLGKSSLLNAGLVNCFRRDPNVVPLFVRFGAYYDQNTVSPLARLQEQLSGKSEMGGSNFIYSKLIPKEEITLHHLWYAFKGFQLARPEQQTVVLIFDQFEELFTYPEKEIDDFKKELSELLYVSVPQQLRNLLKDRLLLDPAYLTKEEKELLFHPLNVKILFSIRSDKLSLLNTLTDFFPSVLNVCYELKPLNRQQARQAIEEPARLEDKKYVSSPFAFTEEAITLLLNTLTEAKHNKEERNTDQKPEIETFQLQIVCKHAENLVVEKALKQITVPDLGNIKEIFENHYRNIIAKLPADRQLPARRLIEEKLIIDGNRVSMPIPFILRDEGMTTELLNDLINTHLLRREQNNTVEISHDTLVEPVLKFYEERKKAEVIAAELQRKEEEIKQYREEQEKLLEEQEQKARMQKQKARRNKVLVFVFGVALILMIGLASLAMRSARTANEQSRTANEQRMLFYKQRNVADSMAKIASTERDIATSARREAERLWRKAVISDSNATIALAQARIERMNAIRGATEAERQAKKARDARAQTETQKEAFRLVLEAHERESDDPTAALRIAEAAMQKFPDSLIVNEVRHMYLEHVFYKTLSNDGENKTSTLSPDGTKILMSKYPGVRLVDENGKQQKEFGTTRDDGTTAYTTSVAFSPDGKNFLLGLHEGTAELWNVDSTRIRRYKGHGGSVVSIAFSPDGKEFLTGSDDSTAVLWSIKGDSLMTFRGHKGPVRSLAFSPDNKKFLTGSMDSTVRLWERGKSSFRESKETSPISSVAFSPDGAKVLIGFSGETRDEKQETLGTVRVWNLGDDSKKDLISKKPGVYSIAFSPDGAKIFTGSDDGAIRLWNEKGDVWKELKGNKDWVNSVATSSDGTTVLTTSGDNTVVRLWKINDIPVKQFKGHKDHVNLAAFSPDGARFVTGSDDGTAKLWSIDGTLQRTIEGHAKAVSSVDFSHDGQNILTASADSTAKLWNTNGDLLRVFRGHTDALQSVAFSKDKTKVLTGSDDSTAILWSINGDSLMTFRGHKGGVTSVAFSPDSTKVLTGSWDQTARLWKTNGELLATFKGHKGEVIAVAFSRDGSKVLTGSGDKTAILWNTKGEPQTTFKGHADRIWSVAFSPDSTNKVLTGSLDGTARMWNANGELLRLIKGHESGVSCALFSPDGTKIITSSWDGTTKLWNCGKMLTLEEFLKSNSIDTPNQKE